MCGIFAVWRGSAGHSRVNVQKGLNALDHRGPDGQGQWTSSDGLVTLGHTRLAVRGGASGAQPLLSRRGDVVVVVNGEFYDADPLRKALEIRGHEFKTSSDSETLIHLYEEHGLDCFSYLNGEFAFVLYDRKRQRIIAGRDRFGVKPLHFSWFQGNLLWASEAKALFAAGVPARLDRGALHHSLSLQYLLPNQTYFYNVQQLPPAHYACYAGGGLVQKPYWEFPIPHQQEVDPEAFEPLMIQAVKRRLPSDKPLATHLSGGVDSSTIAAIAQQLTDRPLHSFTLGFSDGSYDESKDAEDLARELGVHHHIVPVDPELMLDMLPQSIFFSEGLAINGHLPAKYILHREMLQEGFQVVLSGEGADEILLGYPHFRQDLPGLQEDLQDPLLRGVMLTRNDGLDWQKVLPRVRPCPHFLRAKVQMGGRIAQLFSSSFDAEMKNQSVGDAYCEAMNVAAMESLDPAVRAAHLWTRSSLSNYILKTLGDGTEMASSIEGRTPFLDVDLVEYCQSSPRWQRLCEHQNKKPLRAMAVKWVGPRVAARRKKPLLTPPILARPSALHALLDLVADRRFRNLEIFASNKVESFVRRATQDQDHQDDPILFMLASSALLVSQFSL